jgi:C-terminal processing protease CtpA/Prc
MVALFRIPLVLICCLVSGLTGHQQLNLPAQAASSEEQQDQKAPLSASCHSVWNLLAENSIYPDRLNDRQRWEPKITGAITVPPGQAQQAISEMVSALGDDYTYFRNAKETQCHKNDWLQKNVVTSRMLVGNIAYIRIRTFWSSHVCTELEDALRMLASAQGYILDLRDNRGGDIYETQKACGMFLDKGLFSTLKGRMGGREFKERLEITATKLRTTTDGITINEPRVPNLTGKRPVIILVNGNTRSAAEMFAGCLRDHQRALLVGRRTFGKGVIQSTWTFEDGTSIKIAIARYFLPGGRYIHDKGIAPDIAIDCVGTDDKQLAKSVDCLQKGHMAVSFAVHTAFEH